MLEIAILMAIGKIQDSGGPAWFWALLFTGISVMAFGYHGPVSLAITAGYACLGLFPAAAPGGRQLADVVAGLDCRRGAAAGADLRAVALKAASKNRRMRRFFCAREEGAVSRAGWHRRPCRR